MGTPPPDGQALASRSTPSAGPRNASPQGRKPRDPGSSPRARRGQCLRSGERPAVGLGPAAPRRGSYGTAGKPRLRRRRPLGRRPAMQRRPLAVAQAPCGPPKWEGGLGLRPRRASSAFRPASSPHWVRRPQRLRSPAAGSPRRRPLRLHTRSRRRAGPQAGFPPAAKPSKPTPLIAKPFGGPLSVPLKARGWRPRSR